MRIGGLDVGDRCIGVAISDEQGSKVFTGEIFNGKKSQTYQVDPLEAGTYEFQCDVHTTMSGAFIVE